MAVFPLVNQGIVRRTFPGFLTAMGVCLWLVAVSLPGCSGEGSRSHCVSWNPRLEVASGGGHRGPWRMNRSDFRYVDDPTVDLTGEGGLGVAWVDQARKDVFFQRYGPGGETIFPKPVNVSRTPDVFSWMPRMVLAGSDPGHVFVLWQEIVFSGGSHGGEVFFARSTDGGRSFQEPINLSNSIAGDGKGRLTRKRWDNGSLALARGPRGVLYAAWTEYEGTLWFARSTDRGERFTGPIPVWDGDDAKPARGPSLGVGNHGTVYLAWGAGEDPEADIRLLRITDRGRTLGENMIVAETEGHSDAPTIAVDAVGTVHLVFAESPSDHRGRHDIRYTRLNEGDEAFEEPRVISDPHTSGYASLHAPTIRAGGEGTLYALWERYPHRKQLPIGLGFTCSRDGGRSFEPPSSIPGSGGEQAGYNGSLQGVFSDKLAANENGGIAVVNSTFLPREESHIRLYTAEATSR